MVLDPTQRFVSRITHQTLALVLAGGRGQRLENLTDERAKPAVPFAGKFRIIDFTLSNCFNSGIRRIGILTQYKAHALIRHVQRGWGFLRGEFGEFVELLPAQQQLGEHWYVGTADAVHQNAAVISAHAPKYVLVLAGDHIYKMDYGPMLARHQAAGADLTIGCVATPLEKASAFGVMTVNAERRITAFAEKPSNPTPMPDRPDEALASMGIYVFSTDFLLRELAADAANDQSSHDFGKDIIPSLIDRARVYAYPFVDANSGAQEYWRDVGTLDAYWEANLELTDVTPALDLYDRNWPIWTYQEHLPPAKFVFDDPDRRGMAVDSLVSGGCIISGALVRKSLLFYNVRVSEGAEVVESVVLPDVTVGRGCRIRRAVVDQGCVIPPDMVIGEDAVADARRFYVTEGGVTLVTAQMLAAIPDVESPATDMQQCVPGDVAREPGAAFVG